MKENRKPGPKVPGKLAKTGHYCPPGSEGARVYKGIRPFRKVCKYGGHPKFHPGRCVECRRLSDKKREMTAERAEKKRENYQRWLQKKDSRAKIAAWAKRRNARQEQKAANAARQRMYRRGYVAMVQAKASEVAAKLLAKAEAQAKKAKGDKYGTVQVGNYNPRGF